MARKRKNRNAGSSYRSPAFLSNKNTNRRDDLFVASDLSDSTFEPVSRSLPDTLETLLEEPLQPSVRSILSDIEDRRTFHPAGPVFRPASSPRRHHVKVKALGTRLFGSRPVMAFDAPRHVMICVRRKVRDQVLHALGKTGRGSRFNKKPRYNPNSKTRC